jgi:flagellar protein FlgJ
MNAIGPTPAPMPLATPKVSDDERLKKTASQLEAVFVQRMFAAMRDTVPEGGIVEQSSAEQTFTSMMDEKLSERMPSEWTSQHSLSNALYKQLHRQLLAQQGIAETPTAESVQTAVSAANAQSAQSATTAAITGSVSPK